MYKQYWYKVWMHIDVITNSWIIKYQKFYVNNLKIKTDDWLYIKKKKMLKMTLLTTYIKFIKINEEKEYR